MKFYPEDYEVTLEVAFVDLNGAAITPTDVTAKLYNGDDELLLDFLSLPFDAGETSKTIVVPRQFNVLADGELSAARIIRIELETAAGTIRRVFSYVIEGEFRLEIMQNTFLSYEAAEILARNQVNTSGWNVADDEKRQAALIEAFGRITSIPMKYALRDADGRLVIEEETVISRDQWTEYTADDFAEFPTHFKKALRAAQFAEANELLQGDAAGRKHRAGIITETIGESSVTLRAGKIDYGISQAALAHLTGYIHFNVRIARS